MQVAMPDSGRFQFKPTKDTICVFLMFQGLRKLETGWIIPKNFTQEVNTFIGDTNNWQSNRSSVW